MHTLYMDFIGVFVVLVAGLAVSLVVAVLEFCWNARKNADEDRVCIIYFGYTLLLL